MARAPRGPPRSSGGGSALSGKAARKSTQPTAPVSSDSSTVSVAAAATTTRKTRSQTSNDSSDDNGAVTVRSSQNNADDNDETPRRSGRSTTSGKSPAKTRKTVSGKGRGKTIPIAAKAPAARRKGAGKKLPAGNKHYPPISRDDDMASVRSESVRGYNWETEQLKISPADLGTRLRFHQKIRAELSSKGSKKKIVVFEPKDMIWVCPDPTWLDENHNDDLEIRDLPVGDFWIAQVVECCSLDQNEHDANALGVLKIRWCYAQTHVDQLANLHPDYKRKMKNHRFETYEVIFSDHFDFIGLETYAGHADGILAWLEVKGLEVEDAERVGPVSQRNAVTKHRQIWMTGFGKKSYGKPGRVDAVAGYVTIDDGNKKEKKGNKKGTVSRSFHTSDEDDSP